MLSSVRRVIIILVVVTAVAIVGIYLYTLGRTFYNDEDEIGNTAGNIYNGGLFCEQDGKIYFSNDNDDGSLYVMKSNISAFKKVHDDKAAYINVDENYIYYVRANNTRENASGSFLIFNNTGVYRINQNGSNLKAITGKPGDYLMLKGNNLYFQRYDVGIGLFLYKYQIDGSMERLLVEDAVVPAAVIDNSLYYTGFSSENNINVMDLSSFTAHTYRSGSFAYPIFMGGYIYYINVQDGYRIYRMNQDGSNPTLLVDEPCFTYNITNSGEYLFYQVDDGKKNRICRLDLNTMESETLLEGNYKQINVTDNYVFFKDYDNTNTYMINTVGVPNISTFSPPGPTSK